MAAMTATGDLFYYGARGLPRDQPRALSYFQQAAELGSVDGLCGAANMFLKGEGTSPPGFKNATYAIELYERALAESSGSIRALNGLGYIYFYGLGDEVEKNEVGIGLTMFWLQFDYCLINYEVVYIFSLIDKGFLLFPRCSGDGNGCRFTL